MSLTPRLKQNIQIALLVAIAIAAAHTVYVFYQRRVTQIDKAKNQPPPLNADYYVVPKKLYPYDLKSARQLTKQPIWVKEGYRYTYYPYDPARHRSDFAHEAGLLLPIEKLQIKDVIAEPSPAAKDQRQVLAIFERNGKSFSVPIGTAKADTYQIYSDEMFYIQDPHELYKHWPPEVWKDIDEHQIKPGMNEFQIGFAIGMGIPEPQNDPDVKTVNYPNGGKPVTVTYRNGRAAEIR